MRRVILASTSPRRKEILAKLPIEFEVQESNYEEDMTLDMPVEQLVEFLSAGKAKAVAAKNLDALVIAADTFVVYEHHRLGKPKTPERAKEMLEMLSGKQHELLTGVTIIDTASSKTHSFHQSTKVFMRELTPELIDAYIATGEPLDRAGAYALQDIGALLIDKIEGDFYSAMGLPLRQLVKELEPFGIKIL
jgi:septum formation protein